MTVSKIRLNGTDHDIRAKYLIQSTSSDAVSEEFVTKTTTEDGIANIQKIYGNTIKWNQLVQNGNFANTSSWTNVRTTLSVSGNVGTISVSSSTNAYIYQQIPLISGHKYLLKASVKASGANMGRVYFESGIAIGQYTASSAWEDIKVIAAASSTGNASLDIRNYDSSNALLVKGVVLFDLTQIYGSGNEPTVAEFEAQHPADYYPYSPLALLSNSATAIQSKDYNDNVIGNCDLNISTLTGKLNGTGSSVVIFPDGLKKVGTVYDEIVGNKAIKRVGSVDMGNMEWTSAGTGRIYSDYLTDKKVGYIIICAKYQTYQGSFSWSAAGDKTIGGSESNAYAARVYAQDSTYTTFDTFTAALSGVSLYYELATPQEYIIDNALQLQYPVVAGGTEMVLPTTGTASMKMDVIYGNAADAAATMSQNFISVDSMKEFLAALGTQMGGTWSMGYQDGKHTFTFTSN